MPEASVHKEGRAARWKHNVGPKASEAPVQAIAQSSGVQRLPQPNLGLRVSGRTATEVCSGGCGLPDAVGRTVRCGRHRSGAARREACKGRLRSGFGDRSLDYGDSLLRRSQAELRCRTRNRQHWPDRATGPESLSALRPARSSAVRQRRAMNSPCDIVSRSGRPAEMAEAPESIAGGLGTKRVVRFSCSRWCCRSPRRRSRSRRGASWCRR